MWLWFWPIVRLLESYEMVGGRDDNRALIDDVCQIGKNALWMRMDIAYVWVESGGALIG